MQDLYHALDEATEWTGEGDKKRITITDENKYNEANRRLNELITTHGKDVIDELMR